MLNLKNCTNKIAENKNIQSKIKKLYVFFSQFKKMVICYIKKGDVYLIRKESLYVKSNSNRRKNR